jgi:FkbM family methyltransferase
MLDQISRRLRLFLKSELDLQKDRLLEELRADENTRREAERISLEAELELRLGTMANRLGLTIEQVRRDFILQGAVYLNMLVLDVDAKLNILPDGRLEVRIGKAVFIPETFQEIGILREVFVDEAYLVETRKPMYVWDVGANVATASLYFAAVHGWDVSAYELFPQTAEAAKVNIERSGMETQIDLSVFGLGAKTEELTLMYNERSRGSNGMFGNTDPNMSGDEIPVKVSIVDAAEEIDRVVERAKDRPILAKFDCEGAEYDILPRLAETGKLNHISAILMEEHILPGHSREDLIAIIQDAGFIIRRTRRMDKHVSMLFASRI